MKKNLLFIIGLLFLFNLTLSASNRYWVGGSGVWSDPAHWSAVSGSAGGAAIPTLNDNVFFDANSFSSAKQKVMLTTAGFCKNIDWTGIDDNVIFAGSGSRKLIVAGSYSLSPLLINGFKGQTEFVSSSFNNTISTFGVFIYGNWVFNGTGSWILHDDLNTVFNVSISLLKGSFNTNNKNITCGSFIGNSTLPRSLTLGTSQVEVKKFWDFNVSANLTLDALNAAIIVPDTITDTNFRSGGKQYGNIAANRGSRSQNSTTCVFSQFTITLKADSVTCNTLCDGAAHVVVTGGNGSPVYDWNFASTPIGDGTPDITALCASTNTVKVTEIIGGVTVSHFCSISVGEPPPLNDFEASSTNPTCFGLCNGFIDVDETGGTPPYSYSWTGGLGNNDTAKNVCAGTYTATVTDARGCKDSSAVVVLSQPIVLIANGSFANVKCFGACDGTAATAPSGGTSPYTHHWNTGAITSSISALCPGSYTDTIKDSQGCKVLYTAVITQPPVLTLSVTQTNATCNGVCNGTATATVSGGTASYTYAWSNGSSTTTASTTNIVSSLCAGSYTVTVTDANGCVKTVSPIVITQPAPLTAATSGVGVSCFGVCNGSVTGTLSGGTSPYTYSWSGPSGYTATSTTASLTNTISSLCPGTYNLNITDKNNCTASASFVVSEPPLLTVSITKIDITCNGVCNGSATANPAGGTGAYTYSWTGPAPFPVTTTQTISNLCPGTYTVTVKDAKLCTATQTITITQPLVIKPNASSTNVKCNGACNGTATATPTGGTSPYTYSWNTTPVQTTQTISGLCPGTYTVTVTDAVSCTKTQAVTITQPNVLNVTLSSTILKCNGDCTAAITTTVTGGTPGYTFLWSPGGQTTSSISGQCAGTYNVTVTDLNGCNKTVSITVTQPTLLTAVSSFTAVTCFGLCNGSAAVIAGGGTPGYTYLWAPGGQTTSSITNQCAGTYTVTVKDANGCTVTKTIVISQPLQLFGNPSVVNNVSCSGLCDGAATSAATGGNPGYTYLWSPGGQTTSSINGKCAGTYSLLTTDTKGCTSNQSVTITQPPLLSVPITGSTSSCNVCNGTATVSPSGGTPPYTYLWNDPALQTTAIASGLCPNVTYMVTVKDANGCTATASVTISQTIGITVTTSNTTLSCFGACDGIATANASGGAAPYNFIWQTVPGGVTVSLTATASSLCAGDYQVTVSDVNGCLNTASTTFTDPPVLTVSTTQTNLTCAGTCSGTATANPAGGTGAYTYLWSPGGQTTQTAVGLCLGTYTVTVTDASGCTVTDSAVFSQPTVIVDNPTIVDANCTQADGSISVAPTGGTPATVGPPYTFLWAGPAGFIGQGTASLTNLIAGVYTLTITDSVGCQFNFSYIVNNINAPATVMAHTNVSCNNLCDGTAKVTISGGVSPYDYSWSSGQLTTNTAALADSISSLCGTIKYTVTVTDAAGCISIDTTTVINPAVINPNQTAVNESCGGTCDGTITLAPTGGTGAYTYSWSNGLPASASQSNLCAGAYTVVITDANLCSVSVTINLTAPALLTVVLDSTNVSCNGACDGTATANPAGGTGAGTYTYSWSPLGAAFILPNVVNLCAGGYTVTLTDANGCIAKDTVTITQPQPLTASTTQTNVSCSGLCNGIAVVTANGGTAGYTYLWSDPAAQTTASASGLCAGNYNVTVSDLNGCTFTPPAVTIIQPAVIIPNVTFVNPKCNASCNGTAASAAAGGTPAVSGYIYDWSPGNPSGDGTAAVTGLCAGAYALTVIDSLGCSAVQNITLIDPAILIANPSSTSPICANDCNGSVTASPVGGTPGYTYSWSPGAAVTQTVINLCPAIYTVTVTDANSCKSTQSIVVVNPAVLDIAISSTPASCGVCDGTISVTPITGTGPYTYTWTIGGAAPPAPFAGNGTANVTAVCAGLYDVLVTDSKGCDSIFTIPMNNSSGVTGETVSTIDASCNGFCNGSGSVVPIGGAAPFIYQWNDPAVTMNDTAINLCAGNYFVQITDLNTCIHFSPVTINEPAPIISNGTVTNAVCSNVCTGAITAAPSGGTGAFSNYSWTPAASIAAGQGTASVSGLCPGTYTVTFNDANGCVKVDSFLVDQASPLTASIASTNISCSSVCNGTAYVTITAGTGPFTFQWNDPSGQTNDTASALCAGTYSVKITDASGCITNLTTTITASPAVTANAIITNASCNLCDGAASLAPTGGTSPYTYLWSNGQLTNTASNLCSGLYTVNITDSLGCTSNFGIPVSNTTGPASLVITSTNSNCSGSCSGAVTSLTPSGGTAPFTYLWIQGGQTTPTLNNLCAGVYYVQVTDANGCSIVDSVTITEPAAIAANQIITAAACGVCDGNITIAPSGGTAPYTILWNTGSSALSLTNLCAGVYTVQITDAAGCMVNIAIPLNSQNGPSITVSSTNVTCNGVLPCDGTAAVTALSGSSLSYLWNDASAQTTAAAAALCAGTYVVRVTDGSGCVSLASVIITQPAPISFSIANTIDPLCNGDTTGSITVIPSGGTLSYTYSWSPSGGTGSTASNLGANTYIVTVTDANGCSAVQTNTVTQTTLLTVSHVITNPSCNTIADGAITETVTGGAAPYSYQWSGGSTAVTQNLSNILAGSYTVNVTDFNGCTIADTSVLTAAQNVLAAAGNDTSFCENGLLTLSAAGSGGGTSYQWFQITALGNTLVDTTVSVTVMPPAGVTGYYVVVDNGTGCSGNDTVMVTSNALPTANAGADVTIVTGTSTVIGGSPTGTAGASFLWNPAPGLDNAVFSNPKASPTVTTSYTVTVTTAQGCSATDAVIVTVLPTLVIPDGISPNADGDNDEWVIDGIELFPNCLVEVYNRWGELLFQSQGYKEHWKGTYKGKALPVGTYYYIVDLKDPLFPDAYTGPITILR